MKLGSITALGSAAIVFVSLGQVRPVAAGDDAGLGATGDRAAGASYVPKIPVSMFLPPLELDTDVDTDFDLGDGPPGTDASGLRRAWEAPSSRVAAHGAGVELDASMNYSFDYSLAAFQESETAPPTGGAPAGGGGDLAAQATNPIAALIQLQFQYQYVGESNAGDGSSSVFTVQPVIPWNIGEQAMLTRITVPVLVATPDFDDPIGREYGVGDTVILNFAINTIDPGGPNHAMMGPGFTATLPTASSDFTGEGKFQAGPGFVYINLATPNLQWGIFGYQQWSFASAGGDNGRPETSKLFFQPVITKHFEGGWYVALPDILWSIDWNDNARWSIPLGVRIGKVTKMFGDQPANVFVQPFYDASSNNNGNEWGVKFSLSLLFPK